MRGVLSTTDLDDASLVAKAQGEPRAGRPGPRQRGHPERAHATWSEAAQLLDATSTAPASRPPADGPHVVALDFGMKWNIPRHFAGRGCKRHGCARQDVGRRTLLAREPDGVFLSNGPGDPEPVEYAIEARSRELVGKKPIFGICLGHQLLSLACGAKTFKMKFGHRGSNHPVQDLETEKVEITCQNHGFAVDQESLPDELEVTHVSLNDGSIEGVRHAGLKDSDAPAFSVQYHPEASRRPARQSLSVRSLHGSDEGVERHATPAGAALTSGPPAPLYLLRLLGPGPARDLGFRCAAGGGRRGAAGEERMSETSIDSATHEPLRAVIADAAAADAQWNESQQQLIDGVEATLRQLEEQIERLAEGESAEEARRREADEHRRRLEHDLKLARTRVHDLEEALQQRTEELLKAQAANNALAAELQAAEIDPSDEVAESSASPAEEPHGEDEASVTERFAKLRGDKMAG